MPAWDELLTEFQGQQQVDVRGQWLMSRLTASLGAVGRLRGDRHVLLYGSAFLQKPGVPGAYISIAREDINGLMSAVYGMSWDRGLTLILHTPGGDPGAAESIVNYLRSKFPSSFEVIVPTLAMSAGTMIALASDVVVMGRQSQLGPIDPQMIMGSGGAFSARAIVEQFERAKREVLANQATAHLWAPIVQSLGPALLQEAQHALDYSESMVAGWLSRWMLKDAGDPKAAGLRVASHFNDATTHKSHGRRIGREEAAGQGVKTEMLEGSQELQEQVLTAYHLMTIMFESSQVLKVLASDTGRQWVKQAEVP